VSIGEVPKQTGHPMPIKPIRLLTEAKRSRLELGRTFDQFRLGSMNFEQPSADSVDRRPRVYSYGDLIAARNASTSACRTSSGMSGGSSSGNGNGHPGRRSRQRKIVHRRGSRRGVLPDKRGSPHRGGVCRRFQPIAQLKLTGPTPSDRMRPCPRHQNSCMNEP
jgi:hypothetical protein